MRLLQRLLFLLLAANLLLLLWNGVRRPADEQWAPALVGSVSPLIHIAELPGSELITYAAATGLVAQSACFMRGPFASEEAARAAMSGLGVAFGVDVRRRPVAGSPLYRAMIAPSDNLGDAQRRLSEVRAVIERIGGGIDTYLVTSGPIANAVSLGLFSERLNALNVQSQLADEGIEVAIESELRMEVSYWVVTDEIEVVDIIDESTGLQVFEVVPAELSENLCEMIAQAG